MYGIVLCYQFFFFQAEDGIRYLYVTGVQTCALPISRDLRDNLVPVISLALGAVGLTIAAVAVLTRLFVPDVGWAAAITLGAIVAPPDASAAIAVLRRVSPP